jgi:hypothetical protein
MGSNDASSSGDAELDALVRDLSRKVRTTEGRWVRDQTPLDGPDIGAGARLSDAAASAEAQAESLIAALDDADADAGLDAGARVVDVADFDRFATAEMKQEADDIIALMMKYENANASGSGSGGENAHTTSSDDVAALLADAALEFNAALEVVGAERLDEGDGELKELMQKLAGDLRAEKRKDSASADGGETRR